MAAQTPITSTTQTFLDVYDITNDLVIMREGAVSLILNVNAINFGLFAEEEQDAVMYAYAGLLNSLNFPIQIVIKSQTKDVTAYLSLLKDQEDASTNQLKKSQISRYREFVSNLIRERNVLDKKFYVVVTATPLEMGVIAPQTVIPGLKSPDISTFEKSVILQKAADILEPRRDHLISQFARIGLYSRQLPTQEIIQLFYTSYNPEAAEGQQITDTSSYTSTVVSAQVMPSAESVIGSFSQQAQEAQQQLQETAVESQPQVELAQQEQYIEQQPPEIIAEVQTVVPELPLESQPVSAPSEVLPAEPAPVEPLVEAPISTPNETPLTTPTANPVEPTVAPAQATPPSPLPPIAEIT